MINSELLKEAIADAKAVRATALANAKAALEEAFAPRFEAMFADKLKEEAEEEEEGLQEVEAPNQVQKPGGEAKGPATKPVTKGQPQTRKSGAGDKDFKPVKGGKGPADVANPAKTVNETTEEEDEGTVEEAGLTSEDLDEIIKELENEVAEEEEGRKQDVPPAPAPEEDEEEDEVPPVPASEEDEEEDEFPPTPAPANGGEEADVTAEPGSEVNVDLGPEDDTKMVQPQGMNAGGLERRPAPEVPPVPEPAPVGGDEEDDENINLEELLAALNEESDEEEEESVEEGKVPPQLAKYVKKKKGDEEEEEEEEEEEMDETLQNQGVPTTELAGQDKGGGVKGYPLAPKDASAKIVQNKNFTGGDGHSNIGKGNGLGKPMTETEQYKVALTEAYKTIEFLRGQINEVNLLNAKLLYTNKLFKEFAGVLDDQYRMKIVESFDLTKNVREVKLAYALLAESLNFGMQVAKSQQAASKTAKSASTAQRGQVKQITEGFASKPVSSTKPSQLITEANEMALRFKKLAGITETPAVTPKK